MCEVNVRINTDWRIQGLASQNILMNPYNNEYNKCFDFTLIIWSALYTKPV